MREMTSPQATKPPPVGSTIPEPIPVERARRVRWLRRFGIALLAVFVLLGATGVFGARTRTVSVSTQGYTLTVGFPAVTRPGLAIRWWVEVYHPGGFDKQIELRTTRDYLDLFDENALEPVPAADFATSDLVIWTFDPPPGDDFRLTVDARIEPAVQAGVEASTVLVIDGEIAATVHYHTRVVP
jgi:hypothetical protein